MPSVARFSIAPVRSLGLEHPTEIDVTDVGVVEDRRFYLTDDANRLVDRIVVGALVQVAAHTDPDATTLRMTFANGVVIEDEVRLGEAVQTPIHGRTGVGHVVIGPWAEALEPIAGRPIRIIRCDRPGGTRAGNPTSIISDGSLRELAANAGVDAVDPRRFRMLIDLEGAKAVRRIVEHSRRIGVEFLTLYAFSSDNWNRPTDEVSALMKLFRRHLAGETPKCVENDIRLTVVGRRDRR